MAQNCSASTFTSSRLKGQLRLRKGRGRERKELKQRNYNNQRQLRNSMKKRKDGRRMFRLRVLRFRCGSR